MDPMQNLNNAADALNQVAERAGAFWDQADAEIAARQAAYDALAANLKGVVNDQMNFIATVDPDDPNPTNVDGGTFNSIVNAVNASPNGSYCEVRLLPGKTYQFANSIDLMGRNVHVTKVGAGDDPIIEFNAVATATHNNLYNFKARGGGTVSFFACDLRLPTAKPDPALPWSVNRSILTYWPGRMASIFIDRSKVSGGMAGESLGAAMAFSGGAVTMGVYLSTFDGPMFGVIGQGVQIVSKTGMTLLNGATVRENGTIGTDVLEY